MGGRGAKAGGGGGGGGGAATKAEVTDKDAIDIKKSAARELKNALSETGDTWNNKTVAQRRRLLNEAVEDGMMPSVTSKAQQIYNLRGGKIDQDGRVLDQKLNNKIHNSLVRKLVDNKITPGARAGGAVKTPISRVRVETDTYKGNIGKAPSGSGSWVFNIGGKKTTITGSYSSAKAKARKMGSEAGVFSVKLEP